MQLMPVNGTNIHAIGYDPDTMALQIQFNNGTVYAYQNIAPDVYESLLANPGTYFAQVIKPQRYTMPFTKLGVMPLV